MRALRLLGLVLVAAGVGLAAMPTWVSDPGPAADSFAAIERRIPYGGVAGLGAFLLTRRQWKPLVVSVAWLVLWGMIGLLFARVLGLVLDGADSGKQWMWVGVETAIAVAAAAYLRWRAARGGGPGTSTDAE